MNKRENLHARPEVLAEKKLADPPVPDRTNHFLDLLALDCVSIECCSQSARDGLVVIQVSSHVYPPGLSQVFGQNDAKGASTNDRYPIHLPSRRTDALVNVD
jgi:hypothetical protein